MTALKSFDAQGRGLIGQMDRLGQIVVVTGINGAGKSRLLENVHEHCQRHHIKCTLSRWSGGTVEGRIDNLAERIPPAQQSTETNLFENLSTEERDGPGSIDTRFEIYLRAKLREALDARLARLENVPVSTDAERQWADLQELAHRLVGIRLGEVWNQGARDLAVDGKHLYVPHLSEGQRRLLSWAVRIFARRSRLTGAVLLVDEPELHLHPSAVARMLATLLELLGDEGQLWLATHSAHVLSAVPPDSIWNVAEGRVRHAGRAGLASALADLVGDDEERARYRTLLAGPEEWASVQFALECVLPPTTAEWRNDDPQLNSIMKLLSKGVRVVDIGAGQGRVLQHLLSGDRADPFLSYAAVDPAPPPELESTLTEVRAKFPHIKVWPPVRTMSQLPTKATFNVALMVNVLHEIDPHEWVGVMHSVAERLSKRGRLLLLEHQALRVGEVAHDFGFLVLDDACVRRLFGSKAVTNAPGPRADLTAWWITRDGLLSLNSKKVLSALEQLASRSLANVERHISSAHRRDRGRDYARAVFQYVNAHRAVVALQRSSGSRRTRARRVQRKSGRRRTKAE